MTAEWTTSRLGALSINFDGKRRPVKESDRRPGPYPYYGASGVVDHVDDYLFDGEYLLVAEDGENLRTRQTPIAFLARGRFWVNNHAHIITGNERADTRFLMYALRHVDIDAYLTGAVMPKLTQGNLSRIEISHPLPPEQRAIAGVLGALDDKIEQNRWTARALERLARAIFRAWFVDFDPVKAKAAGTTAFPSMPQPVFDALPTRFVDSPIGPVPEGWEVKAVTDVATVAIGKTPPRKEPQWFTNDPSQMPWVSIRDMGTCGVFIGTTSEYLTHEAVERFRVRRIPDRSVLFSFKLTLGRVTIADGEITSNEAIAHFISESPDSIGTEYLYCYLVGFDHNQLGSTSSIATATNSKIVKEMPILVPASSTAEAFTELTRPMFDALRSLTRESSKLAEMRDYLLPKLLSGSVRVEVANG